MKYKTKAQWNVVRTNKNGGIQVPKALGINSNIFNAINFY